PPLPGRVACRRAVGPAPAGRPDRRAGRPRADGRPPGRRAAPGGDPLLRAPARSAARPARPWPGPGHRGAAGTGAGRRGGPQPTPQERAHALLARALMHVNRGEVQAGEEAADRARSIALDTGLGRELGEAATILAKTAMMQGVWQ